MAVFKCKMCGGNLEVSEDMTVCECEYCMTKQTLPRLDDDKKANLYDRAGHFRRNNEFDKAISVYEKILDEDNTDAEAYWSLVLCKYGIEYVEDPATHKRVPTVNRAQFTSVFADEDYKSAIKYADSVQKSIYEEEARTIDEIQKGILAISEKEEPFDVFICYKETDNNGRRTPDSVLANDLYHQLTQDGYKVFFARITLEDKLGTAYEPYIFAALNSAKVMVVLGTKPEYFNAVWVKNEWSRYLALIKNGGKKILIPAYKDMDPYDLPEEFSHLQAQDMSKLGFMQDLIRGIKKITAKDEPKPVVQERVVVNNAPNADVKNLLNRVFLFLEDGDWESAEEYCEKVLDIDFQCAEAYLGKLMSDLEVHKREDLRYCKKPFDNEDDYMKIMRFGDETIKREMKGYIEHINNRIEQERLENAYNTAHEAMDKAFDEYSYKSAASAFEVVSQYKDAAELAEKCRKLAEDARINSIYNEASGLMNSNAEKDVIKAIDLFKSIIDWEDSEQKIDECHSIIEDIRAKAEADRIEREHIAAEEARIAEEQRIEQERIAEIEHREKAKRNIIIASVVGAIAILSVAGVLVFNNVISPMQKYNDAVALAEGGKYTDAINAFTELGDYKDSVVKIEEIKDVLSVVRESLPLNSISSYFHIIALKADGTVISTGYNNYGQCNVSDWSDIVAISTGVWHTVGLTSDGNVVAVGNNEHYECNVKGWHDMVAISAGKWHTVGLRSDGTVVATGMNRNGGCNVYSWTDIVAISAGGEHTVGLKSDGTVVAVGETVWNQCDISDWIDIVAISAGGKHTVGLKSNGTVVAVGDNYHDECDVSDWTDIVAISAGDEHTVGLKSDGTVIATGSNQYGQCDVSDWTDIVAVSAGDIYTVGLKSDGTVVVAGEYYEFEYDISNWTNIKTTN